MILPGRPSVADCFAPLLLSSVVSAFEYDYIIIGGGVCGLTVANRLSELANVTVAVIEAGGSVLNNPNVTNVDDFTVALGTSIDWQYESTDQTYAAGQKIAYHSGKALGGCSTIVCSNFALKFSLFKSRALEPCLESWLKSLALCMLPRTLL